MSSGVIVSAGGISVLNRFTEAARGTWTLNTAQMMSGGKDPAHPC